MSLASCWFAQPVPSTAIKLCTMSTRTSFFSSPFFSSTNAPWIAFLFDLLDGFFHLGNYVVRERRIGQCRGHLLPVGRHPAKKIVQNLSLVRILRRVGNQQPGKAGNRIGLLTWRIGNRDPEVGWHLRR